MDEATKELAAPLTTILESCREGDFERARAVVNQQPDKARLVIALSAIVWGLTDATNDHYAEAHPGSTRLDVIALITNAAK